MYHIIINPASKSGQGIAIWKELEPIFAEKEIPYRLQYSDGPGHIVSLVSRLTDPGVPGDFPVKLIVLGGDGTMNEVIQGIQDFNRVEIGYIPTGSSNDLARDLKYSKDPKEQLLRILSGEHKRVMDLGQITYLDHPEVPPRRFTVSGGIGFDAAVCVDAMHPGGIKKLLNKIGLGKLTYVSIALKQLLGSKYIPCKLTLDNEEPRYLKRFIFIAGMNHRYEGGGFLFAPHASDHDGRLDLCIVGPISKALILFALPTAFFGKHTLFPHIEVRQASSARIRTDAPLWVHTDGEVHYQSADVEMKVLPGLLHMLA